MKKITFFTYDAYLTGGTERVMLMIANELSKKYDVEIISYLKSADKPFFNINENVKIIDLNCKHLEPLNYFFWLDKLILMKKLKNYKTDVFICVGMRYVPMTVFMRKKTKYFAWEHYTSFISKKHGITDYGRKLAAKYADKIIVLTKKDRENNIKIFNTPKDKIVQIYNANENKAISNKYDINSKKIISVGRFDYQKGFDYLVEVAEKVFAKHPDWEWHIYGEGVQRQEIETKIKEKNLENNIILKGVCKDIYNRYKDYSMYVLTSRFEGLGMVIVEAQCSKLPVVSFNCNCGPDELILDNQNGYLVDCYNIDAMAKKINYLIENTDKRIEMSNNSMKDKDKLKLDNIVTKWENIL